MNQQILAQTVKQKILETSRTFDRSEYVEDTDTDADRREWWLETWETYVEQFAQTVEHLILGASEDANGCLVYGATPKKVKWRGRQLRAYQLVAWGAAGDIPSRRSVIRHQCDNECCIHPDHLVPGTQRQNLADQRKAAAQKWADL
jgi:hypothetical protein